MDFIFRAVLVLQENWAESTDLSHMPPNAPLQFSLLFLFIYLFIGCIGSSLLCVGFL